MKRCWEEVPVALRLHHQVHGPVPPSEEKLADIFLVLIDCIRVCVFASVPLMANSLEWSPHRHRFCVLLLSSNNKVL